MVLLISPGNRRTRDVEARRVSVFLARGWQVAPKPAVPVADRPSQADPKADWIAYAKSAGVDTDGLTKAELVAECGV